MENKVHPSMINNVLAAQIVLHNSRSMMKIFFGLSERAKMT